MVLRWQGNFWNDKNWITIQLNKRINLKNKRSNKKFQPKNLLAISLCSIHSSFPYIDIIYTFIQKIFIFLLLGEFSHFRYHCLLSSHLPLLLKPLFFPTSILLNFITLCVWERAHPLLVNIYYMTAMQGSRKKTWKQCRQVYGILNTSYFSLK